VGLVLADFWLDPRSSDSLRGIVLKNAKMLTKFPGLATSGRHTYIHSYIHTTNLYSAKIVETIQRRWHRVT